MFILESHIHLVLSLYQFFATEKNAKQQNETMWMWKFQRNSSILVCPLEIRTFNSESQTDKQTICSFFGCFWLPFEEDKNRFKRSIAIDCFIRIESEFWPSLQTKRIKQRRICALNRTKLIFCFSFGRPFTYIRTQ